MTLPVWPVYISQVPLREAYEEQYIGGVLRTPMDHGPAKVRRLNTSTPAKVQVAFRMDDSDLVIFMAFFEETLLRGVLRFEFEHRDGSTIEARIVVDDNNGVTIGDKAGDYWLVKFLMEILP